MNYTDINRQILEWNKTTVNSALGIAERIGAYGESVSRQWIELTPWLSEEGKKAVAQWNDQWKTGLQTLKAGVACGFAQAESWCGAEKTSA